MMVDKEDTLRRAKERSLKARLQKTELEQEAGKRALRLHSLLDQINDGTDRLRKAFPKVVIHTDVAHPYEMIRVTVSRGPDLIFEGYDGIGVYPSEELVAKIALVA